MPNSSRSSLFNLVAAFLGIVALLLPPFFLLHAERHRDDREPQRIIAAYLKAAYAHDFKRAFALISNEDRSYKSERAYIREKGPFTGFTLDVASKLAGLIESRTSESTRDGPRLRVKLNLRLPMPAVFRHCYSTGTKRSSTVCPRLRSSESSTRSTDSTEKAS